MFEAIKCLGLEIYHEHHALFSVSYTFENFYTILNLPCSLRFYISKLTTSNTRQHSSRIRTVRLPVGVLGPTLDVSTVWGQGPQVNKFEHVSIPTIPIPLSPATDIWTPQVWCGAYLPRGGWDVPRCIAKCNKVTLHILVVGIFVLLIVDVIWVASSELTEYIFKDRHYDKPYFSTYLKLSMFILYLVGFLFRRSWWYQCKKQNRVSVFLFETRKVVNFNGSSNFSNTFIFSHRFSDKVILSE